MVDSAAIVVECRIGDVAAQVLEARMRGDTLYLPMARLLVLAGLDSTGTNGDRSLGAASTLLHAAASFDSSTLVVQFADSGMLPVSRRAARARMRALLHERETAPDMAVVRARVPVTPSAVALSYSAQHDGAVSVDAVSRAIGGVLDAAVTRRSVGAMHTALAWTRVPSDARRGTRVRLGSLDELAGASGILVSNIPLQRDDTLRVLPMALEAAPGTEVELFEDDELVAADSVADGSMSNLHRAQRYGTHVVRLVTHDLSGVEHESRWVESTADALLSRGTLRYAAAVGRCVRRPCRGVMGRVAYAPIDRMTLSLAATPAIGSAPRRSSLHAALDARIGDASVLSVRRASDQRMTAELRVERGAGRSFQFRTGAAGSLPVSTLVPLRTSADHRLSSASGAWSLPGRGTLDVAGAFTRSIVAVATTASVPLRVGVVQGSVAVLNDGAGRCVGWGVGALVSGAWLARAIRRLRSALLRVRDERRASLCGASSRSLVLALPTGPTSALELSASWERARRPAVSVALRRRIGSVLTAHAQLTGADRTYATQSDVAGTVVVDGLRRSISFGVDPGAPTANVEGTVYVDDNANGRRDRGEAVVPGAVVRSDDASASGATAVSDAFGVFVLAGLGADRQARLSVDSVSVEDAGVVPTMPVSVVLTARAVVRVDIGLRPRDGSPP